MEEKNKIKTLGAERNEDIDTVYIKKTIPLADCSAWLLTMMSLIVPCTSTILKVE